MTQIGKLAGMFYEISENEIRLDVVEIYENAPNQHIGKSIYTYNSNFWDFVFDAVIELKQYHLSIIENEENDSTTEAINKSKVVVDKLRQIEKSLSPLVSKSRREII